MMNGNAEGFEKALNPVRGREVLLLMITCNRKKMYSMVCTGKENFI